MTNLDSIFKSRDITLPTKALLVKALVFMDCVFYYGNSTFHLRQGGLGPSTARRSNQSILKVISPGISLEGMMLKLKLQYFGHIMRRSDSWRRPWCWERLKAGGEGDDRGWDGWMASPTQWTRIWASSESWWWTGRPGVLQSMGSQRVRHK